jgi:hypothetical protein
MTYSPTDAHKSNKNKPARMRNDQEKQQILLQRLALSDQATQQSANGVPLAQRRPWWPLLGQSRAG